MEFEWDISKSSYNLLKHKISFTEAVESFADPDGFALEDTKHSFQERRFYWVGKSNRSKILTTWFTRRKGIIRIIGSAEWREFRKLYYEKTKSKKY